MIGKYGVHSDELSHIIPHIAKVRNIFFNQKSHNYHTIKIYIYTANASTDPHLHLVAWNSINQFLENFRGWMHKYFPASNALWVLQVVVRVILGKNP